MNDFTASNGLRVHDAPYGNGWMHVRSGRAEQALHEIGPSELQALREFFRAEADERHGIWRPAGDPDVMVFKIDDDTIRLLHLRNRGVATTFARYDQDGHGPLSAIARAYFDAHPEPKPWHDAKPGEVWLLTIDEVESAYYPSKSLDRAFTPVAPNTGTTAVPFDWPLITAGRRIWPEVS